MSSSDKGFLLGLLGVVLFALTTPLTKLAAGAPDIAGLSPVFITFGRAAAAGLLASAYLAFVRAPWPRREQFAPLLLAGLGIVIGFPLFLGLAVQHVDAMHAAVIAGALPLGTATLTALWMRERASKAFWVLAILGFSLVLLFAWLAGGNGGFHLADGLLLLAMGSASAGYVLGARLGQAMQPERVVSWILVLYLPLTGPLALLSWPTGPVAPGVWASFCYLAIVSMWLGFFAWYRGLAMGGALRVSQVQLVQPFLSMIFAVPLLGETLSVLAVGFSVAIVATVVASRHVK
ncbi:RhaT Permeases of the drug/metabolite transporter (DMT) superfamily [Rhabdaerophilaceae bacterium]